MDTYIMNEPTLDYSAVHTSKGNQLKWQQGGYWYKADQFGFEGVAEYIVTHFLNKVSVPFEYVPYEPVVIKYKEQEYAGCRSRDFYEENKTLQGYELLPIERLHRQYTTHSLSEHLAHIEDVKSRVEYTIDFVENVTGLHEFRDYLSFLIQLDAFFFNEDRHTGNIAVLFNPKLDDFAYCPYFDFGLSLFSDTKEDYPLTMSVDDCRKKIQAKPFSTDFDEQLDACEEIGNVELKFPFSREEMRKEVVTALEGINTEKRIKNRIVEAISYQASKYLYMF